MVKRHAATFFELASELLVSGYAVRFAAEGTSMVPTIHNGDTIVVAPVDPARIVTGDIVLYRSERRVIAHRVVDISITGRQIVAFILRGDAKAACDAPVSPAQILGKVIAIERRGGPGLQTWRAKVARWRRAGTLSAGIGQ